MSEEDITMKLKSDGEYAPIRELQGARNLYAMIILRAVWDFTEMEIIIDKHDKSDAEGWLFKEDEHIADEYGVSLVACCNALNISPRDIRALALERARSAMLGEPCMAMRSEKAAMRAYKEAPPDKIKIDRRKRIYR